MSRFCTTLFPKEEKVGYRQDKCVVIFSATSLSINHLINFPFTVLFYSLPFDDDDFILVVSADDPFKLILWNISTKKIDTEINFDNEIMDFIYSGAFSCVVTVRSAEIVRSRPLVIHHSIATICPLSAVSLIQSPSDSNHCIFAYGNDRVLTNITIQTIPSSNAPISFEVHQAPVRMISLSNNGKYIATVSTKGTIIRIWSLDGKMLHESRRGLKPATIFHMSFSPCSNFLCVSSNHLTSHIFKVDSTVNSNNINNNGYGSWLTFLPKADITVQIQDTNSFSSFVLSGGKVLCSVSDKGICNIYDIDITGNKCSFKSKISIPKIARVATANILPTGSEDNSQD